MGHVFVPHFGEPCHSFILGNVSWYVDASGAALHVTWPGKVSIRAEYCANQNKKTHRRHLYAHAQPA